MTKTKQAMESPLAKAMREGTLGGKPGTKKNGQAHEQAETLPPAPQGSISPRKRLTAYLSPDTYTWTKVQAAQQDRELSDIVEEALRQYRARLENPSS